MSAIYDFKTSKLFGNASTYTCICLLDKDVNRTDCSIDYKEFSMYRQVAENRFSHEYFQVLFRGKVWNLCSDQDMLFLEKNKRLPVKISDIAVVQNGIVTNKDAVYMVRVFEDKNMKHRYLGKHTGPKQEVWFQDKAGDVWSIESTILHRCVKESCYEGTMDNTYVVFPCEEDPNVAWTLPDGTKRVGGYRPITEETFRKSYPKAYQYLSCWKAELMTRDMDSDTAWFLFGRSQGLQNSCYKKVVFKHMISRECPCIEPYILDEDVIVYSRFFITARIDRIMSGQKNQPDGENTKDHTFNEARYEAVLKEICTLLSSDDFVRYCSLLAGIWLVDMRRCQRRL